MLPFDKSLSEFVLPGNASGWEEWPPDAQLHFLSMLRSMEQEEVQLTEPTTGVDLATCRWKFRGAALEVQRSTEPELLISGPANTGKSLACLQKIHDCCVRWPNVRMLILRKTRASLTESALVTYEQQVLPAGSGINSGAGRASRHSYRYPNGSEVIVGGLDTGFQSQGVHAPIMSSEYDGIYVQEAIELSEKDWEEATTRLRHNAMPFQQLLADTNPDKPQHWLKLRCDAGQCRLLESIHEDNPALWDAETKQWTQRAYHPDGRSGEMQRLDRLTGPRKQRLRYGKWVQAEGAIFEGWNVRIHVIEEMPAGWETWPRFLSIDFGFTNPMSIGWWAVDPDGRAYRYREMYVTRTLVEDAAREARTYSLRERWPEAAVCDHDAEGRATFERHFGISTTPADKTTKTTGIEEMAQRLKVQEDGRARLFVLRSALVKRDPELVEAKKPCGFSEEIDGYIWKSGGRKTQRGVKDEPVDRENHAMDESRYFCKYIADWTGEPAFGYDTSDSLIERMMARMEGREEGEE